MEAHSSILAWKIPWREELGGYSSWGCKELDMTEATEHALLCASTANLSASLAPTPPSHSILSSQSLYFLPTHSPVTRSLFYLSLIWPLGMNQVILQI